MRNEKERMRTVGAQELRIIGTCNRNFNGIGLTAQWNNGMIRAVQDEFIFVCFRSTVEQSMEEPVK